MTHSPARLTRRGRIAVAGLAYVTVVAAVVYGIPAMFRFAILVRDGLDYLTPAAPILVPLLIAGPAWFALCKMDTRTPR